MIRTRRYALLMFAFAFSVMLFGTATFAGGDKEFVDLFNGKNLQGWKTVLKVGKEIKEDDGKTFTVKDGMVVVTGKPNGYFHTEKNYRNYVLRYDWRYKRPDTLEDEKKFPGNSGLLVHIKEHKVWPTSLEVQGMNRDHGAFIGIGIKVKDYKFNRENLDKARNKVGEWNTTEVTVKNGEVTSKVNGTLISSGMIDLMEGQIGLQSEGAEIHFKNIKIKVTD